jgi:hypothetical protein
VDGQICIILSLFRESLSTIQYVDIAYTSIKNLIDTGAAVADGTESLGYAYHYSQHLSFAYDYHDAKHDDSYSQMERHHNNYLY